MRIRFLQPAKDTPEPLSIPMLLTRISAGFPSPADEYLEDALDLNELMVARPTSTFFVRVEGDSMINAGICSGDILVVDRAAVSRLQHRDIVLAIVDGEFTVKRWEQRNSADKYHAQKGPIGTPPLGCLVPENPDYPIITLVSDTELSGPSTSSERRVLASTVEIWGIVTFAIHPCRAPHGALPMSPTRNHTARGSATHQAAHSK